MRSPSLSVSASYADHTDLSASHDQGPQPVVAPASSAADIEEAGSMVPGGPVEEVDDNEQHSHAAAAAMLPPAAASDVSSAAADTSHQAAPHIASESVAADVEMADEVVVLQHVIILDDSDDEIEPSSYSSGQKRMRADQPEEKAETGSRPVKQRKTSQQRQDARSISDGAAEGQNPSAEAAEAMQESKYDDGDDEEERKSGEDGAAASSAGAASSHAAAAAAASSQAAMQQEVEDVEQYKMMIVKVSQELRTVRGTFKQDCS